MHSRVRILETMLRVQPDNPEAIERTIAEEKSHSRGLSISPPAGYWTNPARTLHESPGMKQEIPDAVFPASQAPPAKAKRWHSDAGKTYWLLAIWTDGDAFGGSRRQIQVALDETGEVLQIGRYETYLIGVLLVGILLSVIMGVLVTQRGMKPLADIASAAERVTATQLHERIEARHGRGNWPC